MNIPTFRFRQPMDKRALADPYAQTRLEMKRLELDVTPGQSVAVTAGSRGITDILPITKAVVDHFKEIGLVPFIVPAMGSHAGGTAENQEKLLAGYGLTESSLGCPIRSSMETVVFGEFQVSPTVTIPIHFDRIASEADHVFLVNRIKSHTRFAGPVESGLLKMLMIGLGKATGASFYHRAVSNDRFSSVILQVADMISQKISLLGGLGIVENGEGKTAVVKAIRTEEISVEEPKLLQRAKELMPKLPFDELDLLFIRQIGKNISGTGFDSNVVGRKFDDHKAIQGEKPIIHCIAVCDLTSETDGNANGIGMAEFCLSLVLKKVDWAKTRLNAMTANHVSAVMIPLDYETEEEILEAAWMTLGRPEMSKFRVAWIEDTLHLEEISVSEALRDEALQKGCVLID